MKSYFNDFDNEDLLDMCSMCDEPESKCYECLRNEEGYID